MLALAVGLPNSPLWLAIDCGLSYSRSITPRKVPSEATIVEPSGGRLMLVPIRYTWLVGRKYVQWAEKRPRYGRSQSLGRWKSGRGVKRMRKLL